MEVLKLYDCCVPNFRLRPSVARRDGCYVPRAKEIDEKRDSLEDFGPVSSIYCLTRYWHRKTKRGNSKMGKVALRLLKPNDSEERSGPPLEDIHFLQLLT